MKRRTILAYDYKNRPTTIKLPKESWWWASRTGNNLGTSHCVISCYNQADVFYITPSGLARIAYCDSHAESRIMNTMITGQLEQGIWCIAMRGKLEPHWYYKRYFSYLQKSYPEQAKKLKLKLKSIQTLRGNGK
jgi:hypothetical protein